MPSYAKFLKEILSNKRKLAEHDIVALTEECNVVIQNKLPAKLKNTGSFFTPCLIVYVRIVHALCDLDESVTLLLLAMYEKLNLGEITPTTISLQLANYSVKYLMGVF